jgi:hypothetical protein
MELYGFETEGVKKTKCAKRAEPGVRGRETGKGETLNREF